MIFIIHWIHLFFRLVFFLVCFSGVSASVRRRFFLTIRRSVLPDCVSLHAAFLFLLPFRLVRSCFGASLPSSRFVCFWSNFLCGFTILYRLLSSVRSPPSRDSIPSLVCANCFRLLLPRFRWQLSLLFFRFCIRRSCFLCFVSCFVHPGSACCSVTCFSFLSVFPRLCVVLSRSLPVLSASLFFFLRWFPAEFSGLCLLVSFPVQSLGHSLLWFSSLLRFREFTVRLSCVFLSYFVAFPVLLEFRTSSSGTS